MMIDSECSCHQHDKNLDTAIQNQIKIRSPKESRCRNGAQGRDGAEAERLGHILRVALCSSWYDLRI